MSAEPICESGRSISEYCRYGLVGASLGLSDGVLWFTSSSGGIMVGAGTGSLAGSFGICHELNASVCSILGAPDICSMAAIDYLIRVAPLDE